MLVSSFSGDTTLAGKWREGFCVYDNDADDDDDGSGSCLTSSWISQGLAECWLCLCCTEKSRAFSPHGDAKKQALDPDDLRASNLGRPVLSPYPISPRDMAKISHDQHLLHFNC